MNGPGINELSFKAWVAKAARRRRIRTAPDVLGEGTISSRLVIAVASLPLGSVELKLILEVIP
jgi:hypothetical protein